nr:TSUP family transporter [Bartonella rattaustraliani]
MVAGFIDAIAGGGELITLPALLLADVNPVAAIATNKLQAASATLSATIVFARKGLIEWRQGLPIAGMAFLGGVIGAVCVSLLPKSVLTTSVPIVLIIVAIYFAKSSKLDEINGKPKNYFFIFGLLIAPILGFYDGIFGPGVGSFFLIGFIIC